MLELLKEVVPGASAVGVLFDPLNSAQAEQLAHEVPAAAAVLAVKIHPLRVDASTSLDAIFAEALGKRADALLVYPLGRAASYAELANLAIKHRQATIAGFRASVEDGLLMSFGAGVDEQYQRAAIYIDKILRGARPAELPVERPRKFDLVINLKTAKALGLTIPPSLLQRADQVIE
jgi:putative ABC transport system substrate-binding protein